MDESPHLRTRECWCRCNTVDPDDVSHVRDGVPLCTASCAAQYDRQYNLQLLNVRAAEAVFA